MEIRSMSLGSWMLGTGKAESPPGFDVQNIETEIKQEATETSQYNVKEQTIHEPNAQSTKPDFHTKRPVHWQTSDAAPGQVPSSDLVQPTADLAPKVEEAVDADSAAFLAAAELVAGQTNAPSADLELRFELAPMSSPQSAADLAEKIDHLNRGPIKGATPTLLAAFQTMSADVAHFVADFAVPKFDANQVNTGVAAADIDVQAGDIAIPVGSAETVHYSSDVVSPTKQFMPVTTAPAYEEAHLDLASGTGTVTHMPFATSENTPAASNGGKVISSDSAIPSMVAAPSADVYLEADLAPPAKVDIPAVPSADLAGLSAEVAVQVASLPIDPDLQAFELAASGDLEHLAADVAQSDSDIAQPTTAPMPGVKANANVPGQPSSDKVTAPAADLNVPSEESIAPAAEMARKVETQPAAKASAELTDLETRSIDFIDRSAKSESSDSKSGSWSRFDAPFLSNSENVRTSATAPREMPKLTEVQVKNVISQVIDRAEALAASRPKNGVTIHLRPQELGTITLIVKRTGTADVEAQMFASNERVREALESNRGVLLQNLESKGLNVAAVTVADSAFNAAADGSPNSRTLHHSGQPARGNLQFSSNGEAKVPNIEAIRQRIRSASGVDMWI